MRAQLLKFTIVLWEFKQQLAQRWGVGNALPAKSLVLLRRKHDHGRLSLPGHSLGLACKRRLDQGI